METLPQQSELLLSIFAVASLCLVGLLFLIVRQIIRLFVEKRRKQELEADEFAGFVLAKLGAPLNQIKSNIASISK